MAVGSSTQIVAQARPSNAADKSLTWTSDNERVATVDENGLITGVAVGVTTVTVTSNETGASNVIKVTVVSAGGMQSTAYTVSAKKDALISFNPNLPAMTAETVVTLSGGSTIKGMAMGENCLYYLTSDNFSYNLYRFDLTSKQSIPMGQLGLWFDPTGLAYDAENGLFYATAGFYIFLFQEDALDAAGFNNPANYVMDSDYCTLTGVSVINGAVYTFGNDYYSSAPKMMRYSDMYLSDRTVVMEGFNMSFVAGATDIAYDGMREVFYMTDAGHNIYALDMMGNVEEIGILGDGLDLNGLAVDYTDPTGMEFTITFDANGGEVEPESITAIYGEYIMDLPVPTRKNHDFLGWFDAAGNQYAVETLYKFPGDMTLTAKWQEHPVIFRSATITMQGDIGLNFYVKLADEIVSDPATVMQFIVNGKTVDVPMADALVSVKDGVTYYRFTLKLNAKQMTDTVYAQIVTSEGVVGNGVSYSVQRYCMNMIGKSTTETDIALYKAMLNYGAACQILFNYKTDNLANALMSAEDQVLADVDASEYAYTITGSEEGIKLTSATILLESNTTLRVYYTLTGDKSIDEFTFYVDGEEVKPIQKGDRYYVEIRNIYVKHMDEMHEFTVGGVTLNYGVLSYVNSMDLSSNEASVNVARALYAYWSAAEAFFG
jgi:uncharacterized repeat protein (TIGR02543 family)